MTYDLILCECVCGRRLGFPAKADEELTGFVCDTCFVRFRFEEGAAPVRVELTDSEGRTYPTGFLVFSLKRDSQEMAEEVVSSWFNASAPEAEEKAANTPPAEDAEPRPLREASG